MNCSLDVAAPAPMALPARLSVGWPVGPGRRELRMPLLLGESDFFRVPIQPARRASRRCNYAHTPRAISAVFDDPNLVSSAGLVPVLALARAAGLQGLADQHLTVPTDKGANAGLKVTSLVAGMVAGADSIDDMALLRHGGMGRVFDRRRTRPRRWARSCGRSRFGHVRQLDAVASRFLTGLAARAPLVGAAQRTGGRVLLDIDDTDHRGPRLRQAGLGVRLLRGPRPQRAARHRDHHRTPHRWSWPNGCARDPAVPRAARNGWSPTR